MNRINLFFINTDGLNIFHDILFSTLKQNSTKSFFVELFLLSFALDSDV